MGNYEIGKVLNFSKINCIDNSESFNNFFNKKNIKLEISNFILIDLNSAIQITKENYKNLKTLEDIVLKTKQKKIINVTSICNNVVQMQLSNNKKMIKLQLINKEGTIMIDCIIWNNNSQFKIGYSYNFDCLTFEEEMSTCRFNFNKFSSFQELKQVKIIKKQNLINLSISSDLVMYSTYESFGQYCDGWVYGRILNITYKTNFCFKVNIKIDNKEKIYVLTEFDKENLLPSYSSLATIDTMSKDIGKTKIFIFH